MTPSDSVDPTEPTHPDPRNVAILLAGVTCAVLTLFAIIGPAQRDRSTISWPAGAPMLGPAPVGTPIILTERAPAHLAVTVPCAALSAPSLSGADRTVALATTRRPVDISGLVIAVDDGAFVIEVGGDVLATIDVSDPDREGCALGVEFDSTSWAVSLNNQVLRRGTSESPIMSGLYTDVPPSSAGMAAPTVTVDPGGHTSSPSTLQVLCTFGALVVGALGLWMSRRQLDSRPRRGLGRPRRPTAIDVGVGTVVALWAVVGSPLSDDGWVMANIASNRMSGAFTVYYDAFNASVPFGYPHYMLFHLWTAVSASSFLWMRTPVALSWLVMWWIVRRILDARLTGEPAILSRFARMAAAVVLVLGVVAGGMSLRQEFLTGFSAIVTFWLVERFRRTPSVWRFALALQAAAIGIAVHTVGVVCFAPFVIALPDIWRWLRADRTGRLLAVGGVSLVAACVALLATFADTDARLWRASVDLMDLTRVHDGGVLNEWKRYQFLFGSAWGTPLLRLSLMLPLLASVSAAIRWLRRRSSDRWFPNRFAGLYAVSLLLLAVVPSKWPVHLSALVPLAALTCSWELVALTRAELPRSRVRSAAVVASVGVVVVGLLAVACLVNSPHESWVRAGLTRHWLPRRGPLIEGGVAVLALVLWAGCPLVRSRRAAVADASELSLRPARVLGLPVCLAAAFVAGAVGIYVADSVAPANRWSLGRQNLGLSPGECGLASVLRAPDFDLLRPLVVVGENRPAGAALESETVLDEVDAWAEPIDATRHELDVTTPWQRLDDSETWVYWTSGSAWSDRAMELRLEYGRIDPASGEVTSLHRRTVTGPLRLAADSATWRPAPIDLASAPEGAEAVRFVASNDDAHRGRFGLSVIAGTRTITVGALMSRPGITTLVEPSLRPFFPCARPPVLKRGVVEVPTFVIEPDIAGGEALTLFGRSPFFLEADAYEFPFDVLPLSAASDNASATAGLALTWLRTDHLATFEGRRSYPRPVR